MKRGGRIRSKSRKKQAYENSPEGKADLAYMGEVRDDGCIICRLFGEEQLSRTTFHHTMHGRGSNEKTPAIKGIGLCDGHHQGRFDNSKVALHREPDEWKSRYGLDTDYIEQTQMEILGETR